MNRTCLIFEKQITKQQWRYRIFTLNATFNKMHEHTFADGTSLRIVSERVKNEYLRPILESSKKRGLEVKGKLDTVGDATKAKQMLDETTQLVISGVTELPAAFNGLLEF